MSPLGKTVCYASSEWHASKYLPEVRYAIARVSLARRAEIARRVGALIAELECHAAGTSLADRVATAELECAIDRVYIEWGLVEIENLEIDGARADVVALIEHGPERLAREIAAAVRATCQLSEDERKN